MRLRIYHGGIFVTDPCKMYKGIETVDIYVEHLIDTLVVDGGLSNKKDKKVEIELVEVVNIDSEDEARAKDEGIGGGEVGGGLEVAVEGESGEDEDYVANTDEEVDTDDTSVDDSDYDEDWEWTTVFPLEIVNEVRSKAHASCINLEPTLAADFDDKDGDADQLETPPGSEDEEEARRKFPRFRMPEDGSNVRFEVGLIFNTKKLVKEAVKDYAMLHKKNLHLDKNDSNRLVIRCMEGCPFYLRVSKSTQSHYWQVVSFIDDHTCHRIAKNRQAKTEWLAKKFIPILIRKGKGLIAEAIDKWGIKLSKDQAYRAKRRALEKIQGAASDQYLHLIEELCRGVEKE